MAGSYLRPVQTPARDPEIPRLHADYVRRLARSLVFDDARADDVAQDVWVAALEHGPRETSSLRAWLAALARNLAWKSRRGDRRRAAREEAVARPEAVPSAAEILERESVRRRVIEAVLALEEPYRSTIVLRYFEGLEPREVARRLDVPVETVRTREKRAREMLRARLDREHASDGNGRRAWSLALVRELRLDVPPSHAWPIVAKSILSGGLVMSTVKIVAGASAALLLVLGTFAWIEHRRAPELSPSLAAGSTEALERAPKTAETAKTPAERVAVQGDNGPAKAATDLQGSLLVRVRWRDDHTPAADVGIQVEDELGQVEFQWSDARTDADGTCTFDHLRPGTITVYADRQIEGQKYRSGVDVEVPPGTCAETELEIAPGYSVDGEVVDERGAPVSGAVVLMARDQIGWLGLPVARSGADGRFRIRAAPPGSCLCAYLAGRSPSLRPRLPMSLGPDMHFRLVLPGPGGDLEGVVTDLAGSPIADAKVLVGGEDYRDVRLVEGQTVHGPASRLARTDELGRFRVEGLEPGSRPLTVRASKFAQCTSTAEVRAGETAHADVRLSDQVIVEGAVHDGDGRPLAKVFVVHKEGETFLRVLSKTAEDGTFRLVGLPVGDFHLKASLQGTGSAEVDLHGVAGAVLHWDAVLSSGHSIAGRIFGPVEGLGDLLVEGRPTKPPGRGVMTHADADGKFKFTDLEDKSYDLVVFTSKRMPLARASGVSPGTTDLRMEIERASLPSARIRGRLVASGDRPVDAEIRLSMKETSNFSTGMTLRSDPATGRFEAGPLPPGDWTLSIRPPGLVPRTIPGRALAAEETWDLGDVEISSGGVLVVVAKMEDGSEPPAENEKTSDVPPRFFVTDGPSAPVETLTAVGSEARSGPLAPGPHILRIQSSIDPPIAAAKVPFEIVAGQETRLDLVLRAGKKVTIAIRDPSTPSSELRVFVATKDGTYVGFSMLGDLRSGRGEAAFRLLDGEYRVTAMDKDGRTREGTIVVTAGGPDTFEPELKNP